MTFQMLVASRINIDLIWIVAAFLVILTAACSDPSHSVESGGHEADGPLRVSSVNPRYFSDESGKVVYLTGSHTWNNFKDWGTDNPPPTFDFVRYLNFLRLYNHNFVRLWTIELTQFTYEGPVKFTHPFPWQRTGPGTALDGKPRFDLHSFNQEYFDRLRYRVAAARERGIYVSIMLFNGLTPWASKDPWRWDAHPFNIRNNINGIDGDPRGDRHSLETHTLGNRAIVALQESYVRKVVDTVNQLDNVLYEITNETGSYSTEWQYHMIRFVKTYEASKPHQHPVGMTFQQGTTYRGTNQLLFQSPADWISPGPDGGYLDDPPTADGQKVIITDTDHLFAVGGDRQWVWKSFTRGLNPIYMDPYGAEDQPAADDLARKAMGYTLMYAQKINLAGMLPHGELSSSGYALATPGHEYLVYSPTSSMTVDIEGAETAFRIEWFDPKTGEILAGGMTMGGGKRVFTSPFSGDAVLYLTVDPAPTNR